jgi:hypothetical protein
VAAQFHRLPNFITTLIGTAMVIAREDMVDMTAKSLRQDTQRRIGALQAGLSSMMRIGTAMMR